MAVDVEKLREKGVVYSPVSRALIVLESGNSKQELLACFSSLPLGGQGLGGYKRETVVNCAVQRGLSVNEVECLISARSEFKAHFTYMFKLLDAGLSVEEVHGLYAARDAIYPSFSLKLIREFTEQFSEYGLEDGADLGEYICQLCQDSQVALGEGYYLCDWYEILTFILFLAKQHNWASPECAVDFFEGCDALRQNVQDE